MRVQTLDVDDALQLLDRFSCIVDVRSEAEFALDHLPRAVNWPSLNDRERAQVGTLYKQVSPFAARRLGAALVARNIAGHIEHQLQDAPRAWRPLVYCWRGGKRSGALAHVLGQIGYQVAVLKGGYKAFRAATRKDLPRLAARLHYRILCGPTGSGKTRLLHALRRAGAQVLDLEQLACHRASVLGAVPGQSQPSQKHFETSIWDALRRLDPHLPVFAEAESKKVGDLVIPDGLMDALRSSACLRLDLGMPQRVALLMQDYPSFVHDPDAFCERLQALVKLRGRKCIARWQEMAQQGDTAQVVQDLLTQHYDPGYARSSARNFTQFTRAVPLPLENASPSELDRVAQRLLSANPEGSAPA